MRITRKLAAGLLILACVGRAPFAEAQKPLLLVINKGDTSLVMVDPATGKITGQAPVGNDPHEVVASADGKLAFISNYGPGHTLSVVDLAAGKALEPIELGAMRSPHGLAERAGKIYFTAEGSRVIGSYNPATKQIDWIYGVGQERTHMIVVSKDGSKIFTSNVNSDTISLIERGSASGGRRNGPPPGGPPGDGGPGGPPPGGPPGPPSGGPDGNPPPFGGGNPPGGPGFGGRRGPPPGGPGGMGGTGWTTTNITVGAGPEGFDLSPDEKEVWAANSHDGTVSIIDVAKKSVVQTVSVPTRMANRVKFTPDGKHVLVSDLGGDGIVILDAASRKEVKRLSLGGGAAGILMEPGGARAYVAVGSKNGLSIIDLKTLEVSGHLETGPGPDGLAWTVVN